MAGAISDRTSHCSLELRSWACCGFPGVSPQSASMTQSSHVIGPQATVELCSTNAEVDPWLTRDPWQGSLRNVPVQPAPNVTTQIQEMEERLEKAILAKLPCEKMETDEEDNRVHQLELQL